jgi:hypothetical protein
MSLNPANITSGLVGGSTGLSVGFDSNNNSLANSPESRRSSAKVVNNNVTMSMSEKDLLFRVE